MSSGLHVKYQFFLSDLNEKNLIFLSAFSKNTQISNFVQIRSVGAELFHADRRKAHLHRFKIIQSPECVCTHGDQKADHLIFDCDILDKERLKLIAHTSREEGWPVRKCELTYLLTPWSRILLEKLTSKLCS